jgi:flagellar P-ring protein precursor FlgI
MNATRLIAPLLVSLAVSVLASPAPAAASRIRELTDVSGLRENQLIGYGLVVGLANTGDTGASRFTLQSVAAMLRRLGATIDPSMIQTRNAAAVMVTATLPADSATGTRIDVTVSSMGNASGRTVRSTRRPRAP